MAPSFSFDNSYARLPDRLFARVAPTPVRRPQLIRLNERLAAELGLDPAALAGDEGVAILAGNRVPEGAASLAMGYAGHQFGHFVPQLGDGRALLLGEVVGRDGRRRDLQWKGSGRTPYSRGGDGRAALGPVLREYVVAEAMHSLGIPTTRALAAVTTGEPVFREAVLPGAVLLRVASSHLRVGTFEFAAARDDLEGLRALADHAMVRHQPEARESEQPYGTLLDGVIARQARLVARWLLVGFVHGVMNTDNTTLSGETIDYGPCAFLDEYHPGAVWSSIDVQGRYAYANQPLILHWNLVRLAEALLPLLGRDEESAVGRANDALATFKPTFEAAYREGLARKLGLLSPRPGDEALGSALLEAMAKGAADFTLTFRRLAAAIDDPAGEPALRALFSDGGAALDGWLPRWRSRLAEESAAPGAQAALARSVNPAFIPRNHRIEAAIVAASERGDFAPFHELCEVLARPFDDQPGREHLLEPPADAERVTRTFCGT